MDSDQVELTPKQVAIGVYVQDHIDAFGSCLYPSWLVREAFGTNIEGLKWMVTRNLWDMRYDNVLDLTWFKDTVPDDQKPYSIRKLQAQVRDFEKGKK